MRYEEFVSLLTGAKKTGNGVVAKCPSHEDDCASLSVGESSDGKILLKCFAGCDAHAITSAMGLGVADLFEEQSFKDQSSVVGCSLNDLAIRCGIETAKLLEFGCKEISYRGNPAVEVPYLDGMGDEFRVKLRLAVDKGKPKFIWSGGEGLIPYGMWRKPAKPKVLFVCEGESDTWSMWNCGYDAIGVPGADAYGCLDKISLMSELVVVTRDRNEAGSKFANNVQDKCSGYGIDCIQLAPPAPYSDITQWRMSVGDEEFSALVDKAISKPVGSSRPADSRFARKPEGAGIKAKFVLYPLFPISEVTLFTGAGGRGKSTLMYSIAAGISKGKGPLGMPAAKARSLILSREDDPSGVVIPKLESAGADLDMIDVYDFKAAGELASGMGFAKALSRLIDDTKARLVVVDPIIQFVGDKFDMNNAAAVRAFMGSIVDVAARPGRECAIVMVGHHNKDDGVFGSVDFQNRARSVVQIFDDPANAGEKIYILAQTKATRAVESQPIRFKLCGDSSIGVQSDGDDEFIVSEGEQWVDWIGFSELSVGEIKYVKQEDREKVGAMAAYYSRTVESIEVEEELLKRGKSAFRVDARLALIALKCSGCIRHKSPYGYSWSPPEMMT